VIPDLEVDPDTADEWLEADGLGGYAASTTTLCPTRRYHGLLVTPAAGSPERYVWLSRFEETLREEGGPAWPFSVARYSDAASPRGDLALVAFERTPWPRATYRLGDAVLVREIVMPRGRHAVLLRYTLEEASGPRELELRPVLPFRQADALTVENAAVNITVERAGEGLRCRPYPGLPALTISSPASFRFEADPVWFRDLVFEADVARGFGGREDEFGPGAIRATLAPGDQLVIEATIEEPSEDPLEDWAGEQKRRRKLERAAARRSDDPIDHTLDRAAEAFLYDSPEGRLGVVAGFPWFLEWGRDTFLALPGLTLSRGRTQECARALTDVLPYLRGGLLPNVFGATPETSHYGSADAALWFARAVLLYDRAGGKRSIVNRDLRPALEAIAEAYLGGTDLGVSVDEDGMIAAGAPGLNPTWMDARTPDGPVTPRHGCPVEIAALWCSLLAPLEELVRTKAAKKTWAERRRAAKRAFVDRFWLPDEGMLADVWRDGERDTSVRPNMVLAAALELAPLSKPQRLAIVERAKKELLTPLGLRTLSPSDPAYVGRYEGGPVERDGAYHQGTVWPWLLGFYTEARLRAARPTKKVLGELTALWDGLAPELDRSGLDHVSEVFDGDEPQRPGGTFAQAWNTAEWLRARAMLAEGGA
jgi:predicted glycogen debranching enzyme